VLAAALEETAPGDRHLTAALDELLSDSELLTRSLLGVNDVGGEGGEGLEGPEEMGTDGFPGPATAPFAGPMPGVYRGRGMGRFAYRPRRP
jgi:hypothetical protein